MKSYKEIQKKYTSAEIAESLVFPGTTDKNDRDAVLEGVRAFRKQFDARQTEKSKLINQLLQLKFAIEDYVMADHPDGLHYFGYFLKEYIGRLEKKNKEFAQEIDVDPAELSQVINKRRKPTEKLIYRLEIHSNKNFPALLWFKVLAKEREQDILGNKSIIESERKHVKQRLQFSI